MYHFTDRSFITIFILKSGEVIGVKGSLPHWVRVNTYQVGIISLTQQTHLLDQASFSYSDFEFT